MYVSVILLISQLYIHFRFYFMKLNYLEFKMDDFRKLILKRKVLYKILFIKIFFKNLLPIL